MTRALVPGGPDARTCCVDADHETIVLEPPKQSIHGALDRLREQYGFTPQGAAPFSCQTAFHRSLQYGSPTVAQNVETQYTYDSFGNVKFAYDLGEAQTTGDDARAHIGERVEQSRCLRRRACRSG